jgi:hypothetical protein
MLFKRHIRVWFKDGAIAQLVERLNGIQEVRGSTPLGSTIFLYSNKALKIVLLCIWIILIPTVPPRYQMNDICGRELVLLFVYSRGQKAGFIGSGRLVLGAEGSAF